MTYAIDIQKGQNREYETKTQKQNGLLCLQSWCKEFMSVEGVFVLHLL